jgi:hypothetical protein
MSAIEPLSLDTQNRRSAERLRINGTVHVIFGRAEGVLIDLSKSGARIRHAGSVRRGARVRVSFTRDRLRVSGTVEVLASRVIGLGAGPSYETRVIFRAFEGDSENALTALLEGIVSRDVQRWVENLQGWNSEEKPQERAFESGSFIRCRLQRKWWERKWTNDATQPEDGFLLPSTTTDQEIATLCDTYSRGSDEERHFIRLTAAVVVEQGRNK